MFAINDRMANLILDLLHSRIDKDTFFREFPMKLEEANNAGLQMLRCAIKERDPRGVEFGLNLGFHFGITPEYLDVLCVLANEDWHYRHEDVISGLAKLKSPESTDAIYYAAMASAQSKYEYLVRQDEFYVLGVKSTWALRKIETQESVLRLKDLLNCGNNIIENQSRERLTDINNKGMSEYIRILAGEILDSNPYTGSDELDLD